MGGNLPPRSLDPKPQERDRPPRPGGCAPASPDTGASMPSRRNLFLSVAVPLVLAAAAGCGGDQKLAPVTGTLTYKGKPVTNAYLRFRPEFGRPSWGQTDELGHFKLNYDRDQDGAVVGKHKVWLEPRPTAADAAAVMPGAGLARRPTVAKDFEGLFEKYGAEKTTLTVEITPDTKELPLDLD